MYNKLFTNTITLLFLAVGASADTLDVNGAHEKINTIPVIPKNEIKGIKADQYVSETKRIEKKDTFDHFDLATHGNKEASLLSGLSTKADKPLQQEKGYKRPRIGLVLSGGGARGGAHLGIIKAFERHNIPIDAIVGTSMGSFVGGLYASGMSSSEIERQLTTMDWTKVITFDYDRQEIPFRRKHLQRAFPGNAKVGVNQDNEVVLGTGLFKRQNMLSYLKKKTYGVSNIKSFDDLRIPFRSVASRLEDGATVVLRDGSLAESIYASTAIPGGFDPITINGEVLVDGGVADNLPLDVMREEMNVDYIVVVDISTPYDEHAKFDNYIAVMGQLVNILMRKNVEETISSMEGRENEILIVPDLTGYGPLDADKYPAIIAIGEAKGEAVYNSDLSHLSLYKTDYYEYLANRPKPKRYESPVIDKIELENGTYLNDKAILSLIHVKLGEELDNEQLDQDVADIYNLMIFDDVTYKVIQKDGMNVLKITTTPSWDV
ncbi:MAG: patatin-like phospholipase family protein, partial [Sulfurimonadaceae bacterium]